MLSLSTCFAFIFYDFAFCDCYFYWTFDELGTWFIWLGLGLLIHLYPISYLIVFCSNFQFLWTSLIFFCYFLQSFTSYSLFFISLLPSLTLPFFSYIKLPNKNIINHSSKSRFKVFICNQLYLNMNCLWYKIEY